MNKFYLLVSLVCLLIARFGYASVPATLTIDDFVYEDDAAVETIWIPGSVVSGGQASPDPEVGVITDPNIQQDVHVLKMPCHYGDIPDSGRCRWDLTLQSPLDLSDLDTISLRFYIDDVTPVSYITLFLRSESGNEGGWYKYSLLGLQNGWNTYSIPRSSFVTESNPQGWDNITVVRFSPWKKAGATASNFIGYHYLQASAEQAFAIDDFDYETDGEAAKVWLIGGGGGADATSLPVMEEVGEWGNERIAKFHCNYANVPDPDSNGKGNFRCLWDRHINLDLSSNNTIALRFYLSNVEPISHFTLFFELGTGPKPFIWKTYQPKLVEGWQTILIPKHAFGDENDFASVRRVRISPWKVAGATEEAFFAFDYIKAINSPIAVLDVKSSRTDAIEQLLDYYDLDYYTISVTDIENGALGGSKLFMHIDDLGLSTEALTEVDDFVLNQGGKIISIALGENATNDMSPYLGIQYDISGPVVDVVGMQFNDAAATITHLPAEVPEYDQYTFSRATSNPSAFDPARVIAMWQERDGGNSVSAWFANGNGAFLGNNLAHNTYHFDEQAYALGALISHYVPSLVNDIHESSIDYLDQVGEYNSYSEAVDPVSGMRSADPNKQTQISALLNSAQLNRDSALLNINKQGVWDARQARLDLQQAYALSKEPHQINEVRAMWMLALGPYRGDWVKNMDAVEHNGLNTIIINSIHKGITSFYPSAYLEPHPDWANDPVLASTDPLQDAIDEAHSRGIKVEVWDHTWNVENAPAQAVSNIESEYGIDINHRRAYLSSGNPVLADVQWLNPCDQATEDFKFNALNELVENYHIDALQLDFIRFRADSSYDDTCLNRFSLETNTSLSDWTEVYEGGLYETEYRDWKASLITNFVSRVYNAIQVINANNPDKPAVKLSAAVINKEDTKGRGDVSVLESQYWDQWAAMGIVDHLYPLVYDGDIESFKTRLTTAMDKAAAYVPVYPGIGAWLNTPDGIVHQIDWTRIRPEGTIGGFALFNSTQDMVENRLPDLPLGVLDPQAFDALDNDFDDILNGLDNCLNTANPSQIDIDGDGLGDACDDPIADIIVDNKDANTASIGNWIGSTGADPHGDDSVYSDANGTFSWQPDILVSGTYQVYAWWTYHANRHDEVPYTVTHDGGATTVTVNQHDESLAAQWNLLGSYDFTAGAGQSIEVSSASGQASADAVRLVYVGNNQPPVVDINTPVGGSTVSEGETVTFQGSVTDAEEGDLSSSLIWSSDRDGALGSGASVLAVLSEGSHVVTAQVTDAGGAVAMSQVNVAVTGNSLSIIVDNDDANTSHTGTWLSSTSTGSYEDNGSVYNDLSNTFTWSPVITTSGTYQVYAWWTYHNNRHNEIPYKVSHDGGESVITVDQHDESLGGQWNLLGTYDFTAGTGHYIQVSSENGQASADAVKLVPVTP